MAVSRKQECHQMAIDYSQIIQYIIKEQAFLHNLVLNLLSFDEHGRTLYRFWKYIPQLHLLRLRLVFNHGT